MAWWSTRSDGDLAGLDCGPAPAPVPSGRWLWRVHQVHGSTVVKVDAQVRHEEVDADALVSTSADDALAVLTADCAAVALGSPEGVHGAVHAGWRGLLSGVVEAAVEAARSLGGTDVVAGLGPCIGMCCYAFSGPALDTLAGRYGAGVRGVTSKGEEALDLAAAVRAALAGVGVPVVHDGATCTSCEADAFSYRARADAARQALLVWRAAP